MTKQLYATGQTVNVAHRSLSGPRTTDHFKIVRRYLIESGRAMYHVRGISDRGERMVPEDELSATVPDIMDCPGDQHGKVVLLFPTVRFDQAPLDRAVAR